MAFSLVIVAAILASLLGNILVFVVWRRLGASLSRNLAVASLIALAVAVLCAVDLFTQTWVARSASFSGPVFLGSGISFLCLSAASVSVLAIRWKKHRHAVMQQSAQANAASRHGLLQAPDHHKGSDEPDTVR